jgi:predicted dehydrogenase
MSQIRWGVLSTAKIGRVHVIPAIQQSQFGRVTAIASRDLARARTTAQELDIATAYGSYKELLADPEVDAIYNPLPNHLHVPWTIRSLEAGKHVLCEKPIAMSTAEAEQLAGVAAVHPESKVMEAFMVRFHPQWQTARQLVHNGQIGQLRTVQTFFSYHNVDPKNVRNQRDLGGGALLDIGCYPITMARFLFDGEPRRVLGHVERDPKTQVDRLTSAVLEFFQGTATFTCATQLAPYQRTNIFGTAGRIEIEIPFNAPADRPCRIWVQAGQQADSPIEEMKFDTCNQYTLQADAFARAIFENTPVPTPLADAVANMRVIERVFQSAENEAWA